MRATSFSRNKVAFSSSLILSAHSFPVSLQNAPAFLVVSFRQLGFVLLHLGAFPLFFYDISHHARPLISSRAWAASERASRTLANFSCCTCCMASCRLRASASEALLASASASAAYFSDVLASLSEWWRSCSMRTVSTSWARSFVFSIFFCKLCLLFF